MSWARATGALAVVLIGALICLASGNNEEFQQQQQQSNHSSIRARLMQSVLDFGQYKRLFHKTYGSLVEELAHQKYYLSRAFRAFVSSIKYKYRRLTYFLRVNDLSDQSPAELELMDNKVLARESQLMFTSDEVNNQTISSITQLPAEFKLNNNERLVDIEADIEQFIESDGDMQRELSISGGGGPSRRRFKRDTPTGEPLVSGPYEQMDFYNTKKVLHGKENLHDKEAIFIDHRQSGCLFEPRRQGKCGCCYAFAMVAYMEWLHCKLSGGQLLALSEQYLIDCGRKRMGNLEGCQGGGHFSVGEFVLNFGLELRSSYPYRMREDQCPYEQQVKLSQTGHLRMGADFNLGSMVPMSAWAEYLQYGPMIVSVTTRQTNFNEYGGGVYDGAACAPSAPSNHMMLLVGHGREEGQNYWLFRNSYSVGWGEQGYYKLAKSADCVRPAKGFMYGTRDGGKTFAGSKPSKNQLNDQSFVRRHYASNMAADLAKWKV